MQEAFCTKFGKIFTMFYVNLPPYRLRYHCPDSSHSHHLTLNKNRILLYLQ